ncbi:MAG TPA: GFA family protein [Rhizomicrobium sp.]|nr:GFA family protein [Rhizomicrobium sp.]
MAAKKPKMTWKKGGCHCGAVSYEVLAPDEVELVACNCSICSMTGYLHLIVPKERFRLLTGKRKLTNYTFETGAAKHLFCSVCGVKSFYVPRSHPDGYSVNFRCLDAEDFTSVLTTDFDGRNWESHIDELPPLPGGNA